MFPYLTLSAPVLVVSSCDAVATLVALVREVTALMVALAALCTAILRYGAWRDHQNVLRATTAVAVVARSQRKEGKGSRLPRPRKASQSGTSIPLHHNDGRSHSDRRGKR